MNKVNNVKIRIFKISKPEQTLTTFFIFAV